MQAGEGDRRSRQAHKHADVVAEAKAFLASLPKHIPEFLPYGNSAEGAKALQTGQGLPEAVRHMDEWRRTIARFISKLQ